MTLNRRVLSVALALTFIAPLAAGSHPMDESPPECGFPAYFPWDAETESYPVYVMIDEIMTGYLVSVWVYAETNGMDGLQRYDSDCTNGDGDEYRENHDFIVF